MSNQPKVTLNPSAQVTAQAQAEHIITDAKGRKITLKKPPILAQYRLVKMLGDAAKNQAYMGMVIPLLFVVAIDDDPVTIPNSERELDALITRLDEAGISAVMDGIDENFSTKDENKEQALKNS